jgi:hypothetical protein
MAKTKSGWTDAQKAEIVEAVLEGMAEGHTLADTVKTFQKTYWKAGKDAPLTPGAVRNWIRFNDAWWAKYLKLKPMLGQALAEEAIRVARESTSHSTATDRVLIETLKWAAAKANPQEYGEKQTVEHQGAQTLQVKIVEDSPVIKNPDAARQIGDAVATAIAAPVMLSLPVAAKGLDPSEDEE